MAPIKRNENLVLLSRDHHDGLLICWKLRQGLSWHVPVDVMAAYIVHAFDLHLQPHFADEENMLFKKAVAGDGLTEEAWQQHAAIRQHVDALRTHHSEEMIMQFAQLLDDHIRFEERQLFPHYEQMFEEAELAKIGAALDDTHSITKEDTWTNEFWLKPKERI